MSKKENFILTESSLKQKPSLLYGIPIDSFDVVEFVVKEGDLLSTILNQHGISYQQIHRIATQNKILYDFENIVTGNKYNLFFSKDSLRSLCYYIYEPNQIMFSGISFKDSMRFFTKNKPVEIRYRHVRDTIGYSLCSSMMKNEFGNRACELVGEIFAWSIDFFTIQEEDIFNVYLEEKYVDGERVQTEKIVAAVITHRGKDYFAYYFKEDGNYYDETGRSLRKAFLKAPLDYFRISSSYNLNRFHPVLKKYKAHLGTDYAAPKGTPIMSTADGVVTKSSYSRSNGKYVKIKHNSVYSTQYLHMSNIATGITPGVHVKQGQTIGFVGSTGLATGPHVCYRFWKNGKQVDPYKQDLPESDPISNDLMPSFQDTRDSLAQTLLFQ